MAKKQPPEAQQPEAPGRPPGDPAQQILDVVSDHIDDPQPVLVAWIGWTLDEIRRGWAADGPDGPKAA